MTKVGTDTTRLLTRDEFEHHDGSGWHEYVIVSRWQGDWWVHRHSYADHCGAHGRRLHQGRLRGAIEAAAATGLPVLVEDHDETGPVWM